MGAQNFIRSTSVLFFLGVGFHCRFRFFKSVKTIALVMLRRGLGGCLLSLLRAEACLQAFLVLCEHSQEAAHPLPPSLFGLEEEYGNKSSSSLITHRRWLTQCFYEKLLIATIKNRETLHLKISLWFLLTKVRSPIHTRPAFPHVSVGWAVPCLRSRHPCSLHCHCVLAPLSSS